MSDVPGMPGRMMNHSFLMVVEVILWGFWWYGSIGVIWIVDNEAFGSNTKRMFRELLGCCWMDLWGRVRRGFCTASQQGLNWG